MDIPATDALLEALKAIPAKRLVQAAQDFQASHPQSFLFCPYHEDTESCPHHLMSLLREDRVRDIPTIIQLNENEGAIALLAKNRPQLLSMFENAFDNHSLDRREIWSMYHDEGSANEQGEFVDRQKTNIQGVLYSRNPVWRVNSILVCID